MNVSSVAGRRADAGAAVYNMTKFGVHAFSEALRQEALHQGIRVTTVAPGFVETELQGHNTNPLVRQATAKAREQIGEVLQPGDIADAIVHAITRPAHVCVNEVVVRPTRQALAGAARPRGAACERAFREPPRGRARLTVAEAAHVHAHLDDLVVVVGRELRWRGSTTRRRRRRPSPRRLP